MDVHHRERVGVGARDIRELARRVVRDAACVNHVGAVLDAAEAQGCSGSTRPPPRASRRAS